MDKKDLMIILPEQYNGIIDLTAFDYVPETPNDAMQEVIQEKTRIFNNSSLPLFDNYTNAINCEKLGQGKPWNSDVNILCRQYIRQVYLEMFVYREKLIRFIADMFHLQIEKQKVKTIIRMILEKQKDFPFIKDLMDTIDTVSKCEEYKLFDEIRNDEVHNITRIDRINYMLIPETAQPVPIGYQKPTSYFLDNINAVLPMMIDIKKKIEKIIAEGKLFLINKICRIKKRDS